jgi:hypothetical protein
VVLEDLLRASISFLLVQSKSSALTEYVKGLSFPDFFSRKVKVRRLGSGLFISTGSRESSPTTSHSPSVFFLLALIDLRSGVGLGDSSGSVEGSLDLDLLRVERRVDTSGTPSLAFLGEFPSSSVALRLGGMFSEK